MSDIVSFEAKWSRILATEVWLVAQGEEVLLMQLGFTIHGYDHGFVIAIPPSHPPWERVVWRRWVDHRNTHVRIYQDGLSSHAPLRVVLDYDPC